MPAPSFSLNMSSFALATKKTRSMNAFISGVTPAKYVGVPMMTASDSWILPMHSFTMSESWMHRSSPFSKHFPHAEQGRMSFPPTWTSSVRMPSFSISDRACLISRLVFPSLFGLPLNAMTFIRNLSVSCHVTCTHMVSVSPQRRSRCFSLTLLRGSRRRCCSL